MVYFGVCSNATRVLACVCQRTAAAAAAAIAVRVCPMVFGMFYECASQRITLCAQKETFCTDASLHVIILCCWA